MSSDANTKRWSQTIENLKTSVISIKIDSQMQFACYVAIVGVRQDHISPQLAANNDQERAVH